MFDAERYKKESKELFAEWKEKENHRGYAFVTDGVVNPAVWEKQEKRILYILKEAYGEEKDWDLCEWLIREGTKKKIWKRICQWTEGLLQTDTKSIHGYSETPDLSTINNIAVINLKKSNGKPNSDMEEIQQYAEKDKELLVRQIKLCNPTIIVCGYVGDIVNELLLPGFKKVRDCNWVYDYEGKTIIDYYHPADQFPDLLNYYGIVGVYQQFIKGAEENK